MDVARMFDRFGTAKPLVANQTTVFTPSEIGTALRSTIGFLLCFTGTNLGLSATLITRIRIKAGGRIVAEYTWAQLRSILSYLGQNHATVPDYFVPTCAWWHLRNNPALCDLVAFPEGQDATIEIVCGSGLSGDEAVSLGWVRSEVKPRAAYYHLTGATGWVNSGNAQNKALNIPRGGVFAGVGMQTIGVNRYELDLGGDKFEEIDVPLRESFHRALGSNNYSEVKYHVPGMAVPFERTGGLGALRVDTNASYTANADNEVAVYGYVPLGGGGR